MKPIAVVLACLLLVGCAKPFRWSKGGASDRDFRIDTGQCEAQALSAPPGSVKQLIFNTCMDGKGWDRVPY